MIELPNPYSLGSYPTRQRQRGEQTTPPFRSSTLRIATGGTLGELATFRPEFITKSAVLKYSQSTVLLEVGSLFGSW